MATYEDALKRERNKSRVLGWACVGFCMLAAISTVGVITAPSRMDVYVPPDLSAGAKMKAFSVPEPSVFVFAHYIWQQVNRWPHNGDRDYAMAIFQLSPYLTPKCRARLEFDMRSKAKAGELTNRVRALTTALDRYYSEASVVPLTKDVWDVSLDAEIRESVAGVQVKSAYVRYPLRVVRFGGDYERNPYGLALDCWPDDRPSQRIDAEIEAELKKLNNVLDKPMTTVEIK